MSTAARLCTATSSSRHSSAFSSPSSRVRPISAATLADLVAELLARQDLLADGVRHLVAVADLGTLLALERHHRRAADVRRERLRVASRRRQCRQIRNRLRSSERRAGSPVDHAPPVGGEGGEPAGQPGGRPLRGGQQRELGEPGRARPALHGRQPRHAHRDDERVVVRRQGRAEAVAAAGDRVEDRRHGGVVLAGPGVDDGPLHRGGVDRDGDDRDRRIDWAQRLSSGSAPIIAERTRTPPEGPVGSS